MRLVEEPLITNNFPKCHFVYSVPNYKRQNYWAQLIHRIRYKIYNYGIPINIVGNRQPDENIFSFWPIQSPYENTKHIYQGLSKLYPTNLYHSSEKVKIHLKQEDIFIGHPYFPYTGFERGVTERVITNPIRPKILALITPLHCDTSITANHINKIYLDHIDSMINKVDILFSIMGEYWWDRWDSSPYAHWKEKMVRLDMAVDINNYPLVKSKFSPVGKRKILYIGKNDQMKGTDFLQRLAERMKDVSFGWIGAGPEIKHVKRIANHIDLSGDVMAGIASEYDIFISPSKADANPTTILESMAWGFPVICTPQSGYYETEFRRNIFSERLADSILIINKYQHYSEKQLLDMSTKARAVVEKNYNWDEFTSRIMKYLL